MPKETQLQFIDLSAKDSLYQIRLDQLLAALTRRYDSETYRYQFVHAQHRLVNMVPYGRLPNHLTQQFSPHVSHCAPFKTTVIGQDYNLLYWITKAVELIEEKKQGDLACALEAVCSLQLQATETSKKKLETLAQAYIKQVHDERPLQERLAWLNAAISNGNLKIVELNKNLTQENIPKRDKIISMCNAWQMEQGFRTAALNEKIKKRPATWMVGHKLINEFNLMQERCMLLTNLPARVLAEINEGYSQFLRKNPVMVEQEKAVSVESTSVIISISEPSITPTPSVQKDNVIPFTSNPHLIFSPSPRAPALIHKVKEQKECESDCEGPD